MLESLALFSLDLGINENDTFESLMIKIPVSKYTVKVSSKSLKIKRL